MGNLGFGEIVVILAIALLFFGPSRLPQLGKSLGEALNGFKKAMNGEDEKALNPPAPAQRTAAADPQKVGADGFVPPPKA